MLDRAVRIGMIGCGTQANVHFAGIKALGADQAMVAAVCDLDDERRAQLRAGEPWDMQDARQLLNLQKVVDACYESARMGREVVL